MIPHGRRIHVLMAFVCASNFIASSSYTATAHESPEHLIDELTVELQRHRPTAERLYRRAIEYRSLGDSAKYQSDLESAIECDAEFFPARLELASHELRQHENTKARELLQPLLASGDRNLQAAALAMRAETDAFEKKWRQATDELATAIEIRPEVEWYLRRAEIQGQANETSQAIDGLQAGYAKTESPLLLRELCDRLIDAQRSKEAMEIVERELEDSRYLGSWLIRRARIHVLQGESEKACEDLTDAIAELQSRVGNHRPDVELVRELSVARGLIQSLQSTR